MANNSEPNFPAAFWRTLKRLEKTKINSVWMASRNALAVALPLAVGIAMGNPLAGVAVTTGALNVSYSDGRDPYAHRARRMLTWSFLGAFAVFLGSITGNYHVLAICVTAAWAMIAGLIVSISTRAGDLGLNTLVALIVYGARGALPPLGALETGLLVLGGGLLQTSFALLFWPLRPYQPERQAIGKVYLDLADQVEKQGDDLLGTPLKQPSADVQDSLAALGRDHSLEGERFRLLFDQADRLRMSIYLVDRLRATRAEADAEPVSIDQLLHLAANILHETSHSLLSDSVSAEVPRLLEQLNQLAKAARVDAKETSSAFKQELALATDVLAGQLRVVVQLSDHTTTAGAEQFAKRQYGTPWPMQLGSWLATLRANLDLRSSAFRHGVRLAVYVAIAVAIGRAINVQRNYWLPMTVAVVLKPDFTTTISRGVLRLCGTLAGLLLATVLFHLFPASALTQLLLVGIFTFLLRYIGPANYGIFSVAISGLIVFLLAATGISPSQVVVQRAVNTVIGGVFALIGYALWPTWARAGVSEAMANMLDRSRDYFQAVMMRFTKQDSTIDELLEGTRNSWRQARSDAESAVDRFSSEPGVNGTLLDLLNSMLASSHSALYAIMAIEARLMQTSDHALPLVLQAFAHDVEFTLYFLSAALRGSQLQSETFPKLREAHRLLVEAHENVDSAVIDQFVLDDADRLTVSLNTFREQVLRYVGEVKSTAKQTPYEHEVSGAST